MTNLASYSVRNNLLKKYFTNYQQTSDATLGQEDNGVKPQ